MGKYDDIIHLKRPDSLRHAKMSLRDRGAQFSPFAALTGYDAVIRETGRLTDRQIELAEGSKEELNEKLQLLRETAPARPLAVFTCFQSDARKAGGSYVRISGRVKRVDETEQTVILTDGTSLSIALIYDITCEELQF